MFRVIAWSEVYPIYRKLIEGIQNFHSKPAKSFIQQLIDICPDLDPVLC